MFSDASVPVSLMFYSPVPMRDSERRSESSFRSTVWIFDYFFSGWAFLVPYLVLYLIYALMKWPLHGSFWAAPPALTALYQCLHCIHGILALFALGSRGLQKLRSRLPAQGFASTFSDVAPWVLLSLIFWIPGVYLEFPADPWEHFSRINHWTGYSTVTSNPIWKKSSYFLAHSFLNPLQNPSYKLKVLDLYYTGCCLLLSWQYYRLARATGLGQRTSFLFTIAQALTFGNNIFGFYRYYGISSALFAQLGAVAFTRVALESACAFSNRVRDLRNPYSQIVSCVLLIALTGFNHTQGLGLILVSVLAVAVWSLVSWQPKGAWWLLTGAAAASAAVLWWWPASPQSGFQPPPSWTKATLLDPSSPLFDRAIGTLGVVGLLNFIAGLILTFRRRFVGWLTVLPVIVLCLPLFLIPLLAVLAADDSTAQVSSSLISYYRLIFAIPCPLALLHLALDLFEHHSLGLKTWSGSWPAFVTSAIAAFMLVPPDRGFRNRHFNVFLKPPHDLTLSATIPLHEEVQSIEARYFPEREPLIFLSGSFAFAGASYGKMNSFLDYVRLIRGSEYPAPSVKESTTLRAIAGAIDSRQPTLIAVAEPTSLYTPVSLSAVLSEHWSPHEVALQQSGGAESLSLAKEMGAKHGKPASSSPLRFKYLVFKP